jgi:hypothetical protein
VRRIQQASHGFPYTYGDICRMALVDTGNESDDDLDQVTGLFGSTNHEYVYFDNAKFR